MSGYKIIPMTIDELARLYISLGRNPDYIAKNYRSNAKSMRERAELIRRKGEGSKIAGYTLQECLDSSSNAEHNAVAVPARMRELMDN